MLSGIWICNLNLSSIVPIFFLKMMAKKQKTFPHSPDRNENPLVLGFRTRDCSG
jgi:hypothetical protein